MSCIFLGYWPIAYWRCIIGGANKLGLHKKQKILSSASLTFIELAYSLGCTGLKQEIDSFQDGGPMKMQKSIQHHSPKPLSII
jgi:hypothetical protein